MEVIVNKVKRKSSLSKKTKIIIIIILLIIGVIGLFLYHIKNKQMLFINSYTNNSWGSVSRGYIIYANGKIEEYDVYNDDAELKKAKISKEELRELKSLANSINSNYVDRTNSANFFDAGLIEKKIYNSKEKKWILLYQSGDKNGYNDTEETEKIIELTQQLYKKYLQNDV